MFFVVLFLKYTHFTNRKSLKLRYTSVWF